MYFLFLAATVARHPHPKPSAPAAVLAACDPKAPAQAWGLREGAKWGDPNNLVQLTAKATCLDVADRSKGDGAPLRPWACCCTGGDWCGKCSDEKDNYNQQYDLDASGRVTTDVAKMGGRCLTVEAAVAGAAIATHACGEAKPNNWLVYDATKTPALRLAANASLCLSTSGGASPGPSPSPPGPPGPWAPVPQACTQSNTSGLPFCDTKLSIPARIADLLQRMPTSDKLQQLIGGIRGGITPGVATLGIPPYQIHSEGLHGLRSTCNLGPGKSKLYSTMFPQVTGMAATGNLTLVGAMADHMSTEARAVNNEMKGNAVGKGGGLNYWGPTMNVGRDPRWGRFQESVSECPWYNGAYSVHYVRGFQGAGDGVDFIKAASCCKHFYAYSLESSDGFDRHNFNAIISPKMLAETYNMPFAMCVTNAAPEQIMCSYNSVNGVPTCLDDHAQNGFLRGELGYDGLIVSDCDAIGDAYKTHHYSSSAADAAASGIKAGCDLDCGSTYKADNLQTAISAGNLSIPDIDIAVGRVMTMRMRAGLFDPAASVPYTDISTDVMNSRAGQALALEAAEQSVVLLKNDQSLLPINPVNVKSIAVVGPTANDSAIMMGGKSDYCPEFVVSICDGILARATKAGVAATCDPAGPGWDFAGELSPAQSAARKASVATAAQADLVIVAVGGIFGAEARDRTNISLPASQIALVESILAQAADPTHVVLVMVNGDPIAMDTLAPRLSTIVDALEGGQSGGTGLANVLFGDVSPSGMLPFTIYPDDYVTKVPMSDMTLRPNKKTGSPGKTYRFYTDEPTFPFGFGLSYTSWSFKWANPPAKSQAAATLSSAGLVFQVAVTNTGKVDSAKIVQLYVKQMNVPDAPLRSLAALTKVFVAAGETALVSLNTTAFESSCPFCVVAEDGRASVPVGTEYSVSVGDGSADYFAATAIVAA